VFGVSGITVIAPLLLTGASSVSKISYTVKYVIKDLPMAPTLLDTSVVLYIAVAD
jgi:hypothetical protein